MGVAHGTKSPVREAGGRLAEAGASVRGCASADDLAGNLSYHCRPPHELRRNARRARAGAPRSRRHRQVAAQYQSALRATRGRILGQIIKNHYGNHYSAPHPKRGKLKYVIQLRMWRNWQTRWI